MGGLEKNADANKIEFLGLKPPKIQTRQACRLCSKSIFYFCTPSKKGVQNKKLVRPLWRLAGAAVEIYDKYDVGVFGVNFVRSARRPKK